MASWRSLESKSVSWVYGIMFLCSAGADYWGFGDSLHSWRGGWGPSLWPWVAGVSFIVLSIIFLVIVSSIFQWAMELEKVLQQILTPLSYLHIVLLAIIGALIEEWFFRGVLMSHFGLIVATIVYALCHLLADLRLWPWALWALVSGLFFGWLKNVSDSLLLVATIHASLNFLWLLRLNASAHRASTSARNSLSA